jgi:hydroxymethylbilane synthase
MTDLIDSSQTITWDEMLPAVAQGAIGIQCRSEDSRMLTYLAGLNHDNTKLAVDCERSFLGALDGNCRTPIAGQARIEESNGKKMLHFKGLISKPDGSDMIRVERAGEASEAVAIGLDAANEIRSIAGEKFIEYQQAMQVAGITL